MNPWLTRLRELRKDPLPAPAKGKGETPSLVEEELLPSDEIINAFGCDKVWDLTPDQVQALEAVFAPPSPVVKVGGRQWYSPQGWCSGRQAGEVDQEGALLLPKKPDKHPLCGHTTLWLSRHGVWVCMTCHPPAPGAAVWPEEGPPRQEAMPAKIPAQNAARNLWEYPVLGRIDPLDYRFDPATGTWEYRLGWWRDKEAGKHGREG